MAAAVKADNQTKPNFVWYTSAEYLENLALESAAYAAISRVDEQKSG